MLEASESQDGSKVVVKTTVTVEWKAEAIGV